MSALSCTAHNHETVKQHSNDKNDGVNDLPQTNATSAPRKGWSGPGVTHLPPHAPHQGSQGGGNAQSDHRGPGDATGILAGYIYRSPAGGTADGPRLLCTMALRPLASSLTPLEEDDFEDRRKLCERYSIYRGALEIHMITDTRPSPPTSPPPPPGQAWSQPHT